MSQVPDATSPLERLRERVGNGQSDPDVLAVLEQLHPEGHDRPKRSTGKAKTDDAPGGDS